MELGSAYESTTTATFRASRVQRLKAFREIVYSGCWEDTDTELAALALPRDARVLSITASGSRSLGLLAAAPREILSVDLNPSQNFLLELKRASALGARCWEEHVAFLGVTCATPNARAATYARARPHLGAPAREYWDAREQVIRTGVVHAGRQDRVVSSLGRLARSVLPERRIRPLFEFTSIAEQARYFDEHIDTPLARAIARIGTSKWALRFIYGRDLYEQAGFFSMGEMIYANIARHAHSRLFRENYFLANVLLGKYLDARRVNSFYLTEQTFEVVRARAAAVRPVTAPLEDVLASLPDASIDGFSFSDIFDWIAPPDFDRVMHEVTRVARPGARVCYRVCLVERTPSAAFDGVLVRDPSLESALEVADRSCFYRGLFVATVTRSTRAGERAPSERPVAEHDGEEIATST